MFDANSGDVPPVIKTVDIKQSRMQYNQQICSLAGILPGSLKVTGQHYQTYVYLYTLFIIESPLNTANKLSKVDCYKENCK